MKKIFFFILFHSFVFAQSTIKIVITNTENQPIVRAIVVFEQAENQVAFGTTDNNGILEQNLLNGVYRIKVSKLGFVAITQTINVNRSQNTAVVLERVTTNLETVISNNPLKNLVNIPVL